MANPPRINAPFPLNDAATPLFGGANTSQYTYDVPDLPDGSYTISVLVTNDETVPSTTLVPYSIDTSISGGGNGFTDLFDGVGILLEAALVADASDNDPVWTDLSGRVRSLTFSRGRQRELERWEPGTLTAVLDNRDRALDPNQNPLVSPMRRVRLQAQYNGHSYAQWYGFADSWPQAWQLGAPGGGDAYVTLQATDAFKVFANATVFPSAYFTTVVASAPIAYYRLNEKAGRAMADSSGHRHDGSYSQNSTTSRSTAGLIAFDDDTAIAFDGTDDFAFVPIAAQPTTYPFTIAGWFSTSDSTAPIWFQTTGDTAYYAEVYLFGGSLVAQVVAPTSNIYTRFGSGGTIQSNTAAIYADGNPHHFLCRFLNDHTAPLIYVDGVNVTTGQTVTNVAEVPYGKAYLGLEKRAGGHAAATLDEIAIYKTDLGATAAATHFQAATNPWVGDTSGQRIDRILDAMGWPANDREYIADIAPGGNTFVASQDLRGKTGLENLLKVVDTEFGAGWMSTTGKFHYRERHAIYTEDRYKNAQHVFGDDGTNANELPWANLVLGSSDELIRNDVVITTSSNVTAQAEDSSSIAQNLRFTYSDLSDLLLTNVDDAYGLANWVLNHYADPLQRIEQIQINARHPKNPTDLWIAVLTLDLEDRIQVIRRPPGGGLPIVQEAHVEHIDVSIDPQGAWDVTLQLSPAEELNVWIWDDPATFWDASVWAY